jgi:cytoskeletal protein RodZ
MDNLGNALQTAREAKGISLQEVENATHIRARYLEALELGDYEVMPGGEAQVRGFLRRYAAFLGLSAEEAVSRYNEQVHGGNPNSLLPVPLPAVPTSAGLMGVNTRSRRHLPIITAGAAIILILALGSWWLFFRPRASTAPTATPSPPVTQAAVQPTSSPASDVTPIPQAAATTPLIMTGETITLTLEPLEHVWARVTVDGFTAFEGLLNPAEPRSWAAEEIVVVETGNGAGLIAMVNGQSQGLVGGRGEVSARGWGLDGEFEVPLPQAQPSDTEEGS